MINVNLQLAIDALTTGYQAANLVFDALEDNIVNNNYIREFETNEKEKDLAQFEELEKVFTLLKASFERVEILKKTFEEKSNL
ncbi:MAG: hypothetical protein ABI663_20910 [Chryseolinea sp.]